MLVNSKQAIEYTTMAMRAKLVTMLHGDPGIGKSAIVNAIAEQFKLQMIDIRLSQIDPTELNGFASIQNGIAQYVPLNIFPLAAEKGGDLKHEEDGDPAKGETFEKGDWVYPDKFHGTPIPAGKTGFLLFLDELSSAPLSVQTASFKLTLDRMVGQHKLHPNTVIICAGNLSTNGAIVNRISTPMQSRLVHLELTVDVNAWTEWASKNKLDFRVISYVHNLPDKLHSFDPKHSDKTFACPRTWEFVSKVLAVSGSTPLRDMLPLLAGIVGEGVAREFIMYTETLTKLPTIDEILKNPFQAKLDKEPSLLYAVSHMVATHAKASNIVKIMDYIGRMPFEFETITLQNILRRDVSLKNEEVIQDWVIAKGEELL